MKKFYRFILSIALVLAGTNGIRAQVSQGDFQYSASISGGLQSPARMAIDNNDNIYVIDVYAKNILKFDPAGNNIATFTIAGSPVSLAVNTNNVLFAGDAISGNILQINANGSSSIFCTGAVFPNSMTFGPDNHLYVADSKLHKVLVFGASGQLIQSIGEGTLLFPTGIDYDHKNNRILVGEHGADNDNLQTRVYIYSPDGTLLNLLGSYGSSNGKFYRVQGVKSGRCGNIYVCEPFQGNISVFNENGVFITKFGQFGVNPGELNVPMDMVFDSQERIWISSMNNGALEVYTINDPLPSASITSGNIGVCEGQSADITIQLSGTPPWSLTYTINGQNPVNLSGITSNPYHLIVSQPGTYLVTALSDSSAAGTCFSGSSTVTINQPPSAALTSGNAAICEGQSYEIPVLFTGEGPWTITYTHNGSNPQTISNINANPYLLNVSAAGSYEITSVEGSQCSGVVIAGNAVLEVHPLPSAMLENVTDSICEGEIASLPVYFTGTPPWIFDYTINGLNPVTVVTSTNPYILTATNSGYYTLSAMSDANCTSTNFSGFSEESVSPKPVPAFNFHTNNLTISLFNTSQNATSYHWTFGDNTVSNQVDPIHTFLNPGTYTIRLGCWNESCKSFVVQKTVTVPASRDTAVAYDINYGKTGMNEKTEFSAEVYPNPSNGRFILELSNVGQSLLHIEITNITGQLVFEKTCTLNQQAISTGFYTETIDLSDFSDGIYGLKISSGECVKTNRLVLNK